MIDFERFGISFAFAHLLTLGRVSKLPTLAQPKGPLFIQLARMDIINQR